MKEGHNKFLTVVAHSTSLQPPPAYPTTQLLGISNEPRLQVPISPTDEVERTKLSIKQKAAELTKKTRSSFRRKNGQNGVGGAHGGSRKRLPRERQLSGFILYILKSQPSEIKGTLISKELLSFNGSSMFPCCWL